MVGWINLRSCCQLPTLRRREHFPRRRYILCNERIHTFGGEAFRDSFHTSFHTFLNCSISTIANYFSVKIVNTTILFKLPLLTRFCTVFRSDLKLRYNTNTAEWSADRDGTLGSSMAAFLLASTITVHRSAIRKTPPTPVISHHFRFRWPRKDTRCSLDMRATASAPAHQ